MTLDQWINRQRHAKRLVTAKSVAEQIDCSPTNLSRAMNGRSILGLIFVQRIHALTEGEVSLMDWPTGEPGTPASSEARP